MSEAKFYDAHCHIMNLSHPNLLAFLQRLNLPLIMLFAPILPFLLKWNYNKLKNLLAVMENDLGTLLLMIERFLLEDENLWEDGLSVTKAGPTQGFITISLLKNPSPSKSAISSTGSGNIPKRARAGSLRSIPSWASTLKTIPSMTKPALRLPKGRIWDN